MKLKSVLSLLAFGIMIVACNTPTPPTPAFKLKPAETTLEIPAGAQATSFVALERDAGFTDTVQMTFQDLPAGFTQEWTRDTSNGDCGVRLQVAKTVAPGEYTLNVAGLIGSDVKSASSQTRATTAVTVPVKVIIPDLTKFFPFLISSSPTVVSEEPGFSAKFGVNITQFKVGFTENVQLTVQGLPLNVSASFSQNPVKVQPGTRSSVLSLAIANNALPGTYALSVTGTSPSYTAPPTFIQLTILQPATQGFRLIATPLNDTFMQERGGTFGGDYSLKLERKAGFTAPIEITAQNVPADTHVSFLANQAVMRIQTGFAAIPGTQTLTLKGTAGIVVNTIPITYNLLSRFELPEASNTGTNALDSSFTNIPVPGLRILPEITGMQFPPQVGFSSPKQVPLLALADGKVLTSVTAQGAGDQVARLNSDGTLDSGFVKTSLAAFVKINVLALQSDGKILVSQSSLSSVISRLNPNGSLDTSFGINGHIDLTFLNIGLGTFVLAMTQTSLDRILIITPHELIRLTPGGNFDPDFDGDGRKPITFPNINTTSITNGVGLTDAQGRFVIATNENSQIKVFRMLQDGTPDLTYTRNGVALPNLQLSGRGIALDSQNRLVMPVVSSTGGLSDPAMGVVRLTVSGDLDNSFDTDGLALISFGTGIHSAYAVSALGGKILVVGSARLNNLNSTPDSNGDFAAARLNQDGSLDSSFGTNGKFLMGFKNPEKPNPEPLGFQEGFTAVVGLPNNSAFAFGFGFGNFLANGDAFVSMTKFNP